MFWKNSDEDIFEFIKDTNQFMNQEGEKPGLLPNDLDNKSMTNFKRSAKTTILLDTKPLNYILNPTNVIPWEEFTADYMYSDSKLQDMFLTMLMEDLEQFKNADDVRKLSQEKFKIVDNLYSSKLV